jgi:hypothetical protein
VLALVVASRFGMLLGLSLWLGLTTALVLLLPAVERQLPPEQSAPLSRALYLRGDLALVGAAALVLLGLGARVMIDRAAPPTSIGLPVAAMTLVRVVSLIFLVSAPVGGASGSKSAADPRGLPASPVRRLYRPSSS